MVDRVAPELSLDPVDVNKFGWRVLTTGHKSEIAVGYSMLYGDMAEASP